MREKLIEIIDRNYDSDIGELDKSAIVEDILELLNIKNRYVIGSVENPFNQLEDDQV